MADLTVNIEIEILLFVVVVGWWLQQQPIEIPHKYLRQNEREKLLIQKKVIWMNFLLSIRNDDVDIFGRVVPMTMLDDNHHLNISQIGDRWDNVEAAAARDRHRHWMTKSNSRKSLQRVKFIHFKKVVKYQNSIHKLQILVEISRYDDDGAVKLAEKSLKSRRNSKWHFAGHVSAAPLFFALVEYWITQKLLVKHSIYLRWSGERNCGKVWIGQKGI